MKAVLSRFLNQRAPDAPFLVFRILIFLRRYINVSGMYSHSCIFVLRFVQGPWPRQMRRQVTLIAVCALSYLVY